MFFCDYFSDIFWLRESFGDKPSAASFRYELVRQALLEFDSQLPELGAQL